MIAATVADIRAFTACERPNISTMRRALAMASKLGPVGATAATIIKFQGSTIGRLVESGSLDAEQFRAAQEIDVAFRAIAGRASIAAIDLARVGSGRMSDVPWSAMMRDTVDRYTAWANAWSNAAKRGDKTLSIILAAVVDDHSVRQIAADKQVRKSNVSKIIGTGLREYASRSGWMMAA